MALRDLPRIKAITDAVATTNTSLDGVLAELRQTNDQRLLELNNQIAELNRKMDRLVKLRERDVREG